jgi:hypothetical protein
MNSIILNGVVTAAPQISVTKSGARKALFQLSTDGKQEHAEYLEWQATREFEPDEDTMNADGVGSIRPPPWPIWKMV